MVFTVKNQFNPDYAIHPGEILEETLQARGIKKVDLAKRIGLSEKTINQIIHEKAPVTPETAIQLERVLGVSAAIWNNLEAFYRLHIARESSRKQLGTRVEWIRSFPVKELVKRGVIDKPIDPIDTAEKLLNFFAIGSIEAWENRFNNLAVNFRHSNSFKSAPESVATWLRIGELKAEEIVAEPYNKGKFIASLYKIRELTSKPPEVFEPRMKELCREAGVVLVFAYELQKTHLFGATRWLTPEKALIILSLRYKTDDHFWFSFFHEAGHILHHGKKDIFLDEKEMEANEKEKEADRFATKILIPDDKYQTFVKNINNKHVTKQLVCNFAGSVNVAPGIVVGRLQHDHVIPYSLLNGLKRKFELLENN